MAEELVFGPEKVTTGAANDIERATELARRMVTQFGMSDVIGPIAVGDREQQIFLGREIAQRNEVSEKTAEIVDAEVKHVLDASLRRARQILEELRRRAELESRAGLIRSEIPRADWTDAVSAAFGTVKATLERSGKRIEDFDAAIAAHALAVGATLVTANVGQVTRVPGLAVEDWTAEPS